MFKADEYQKHRSFFALLTAIFVALGFTSTWVGMASANADTSSNWLSVKGPAFDKSSCATTGKVTVDFMLTVSTTYPETASISGRSDAGLFMDMTEVQPGASIGTSVRLTPGSHTVTFTDEYTRNPAVYKPVTMTIDVPSCTTATTPPTTSTTTAPSTTATTPPTTSTTTAPSTTEPPVSELVKVTITGVVMQPTCLADPKGTVKVYATVRGTDAYGQVPEGYWWFDSQPEKYMPPGGGDGAMTVDSDKVALGVGMHTFSYVDYAHLNPPASVQFEVKLCDPTPTTTTPPTSTTTSPPTSTTTEPSTSTSTAPSSTSSTSEPTSTSPTTKPTSTSTTSEPTGTPTTSTTEPPTSTSSTSTSASPTTTKPTSPSGTTTAKVAVLRAEFGKVTCARGARQLEVTVTNTSDVPGYVTGYVGAMQLQTEPVAPGESFVAPIALPNAAVKVSVVNAQTEEVLAVKAVAAGSCSVTSSSSSGSSTTKPSQGSSTSSAQGGATKTTSSSTKSSSVPTSTKAGNGSSSAATSSHSTWGPATSANSTGPVVSTDGGSSAGGNQWLAIGLSSFALALLFGFLAFRTNARKGHYSR